MKLMDRVRTEMRRRRYSYRTEQSYAGWIVRFIRFHSYRHPRELADEDVLAFLNYLAAERGLSASSQNQALNALNFLYKRVLERELGDLGGRLVRARRRRRLPVVLSKSEVKALLSRLSPPYLLMAQLLYGAGLRLRECVGLRVMDVDFAARAILVRSGKGDRDRRTILPEAVASALSEQVKRSLAVLVRDYAARRGGASLPQALERKYPEARFTSQWQYVFPASQLSNDPVTGRRRRHHVYPQNLQRAVAKAARNAGLHKRVGCHTLRHTFATQMLEAGWDVRTIQLLMGHKNLNTTMIYTHVVAAEPCQAISPLDALDVEPERGGAPWPLRATPDFFGRAARSALRAR